MVRCLPGAPSWSFKICSMASSRKASLLVILAFFLGYGESGRTLPLWEVGSSGDGSEVLVHDLRRCQTLVTHLDNVSQMFSILLFVPSGLKECAKSRCDIDKRYTCWLFQDRIFILFGSHPYLSHLSGQWVSYTVSFFSTAYGM